MADDGLIFVNDDNEDLSLEQVDTPITDGVEELEEVRMASLALLSSGSGTGDEEEDTGSKPKAPHSYSMDDSEKVDLQYGSLQYTVTDFVIPGKNGFDLRIARQYDSSCSNMKRYYPVFKYNSNGFLGVLDESYDNNYYTKMYGLGHGWKFVLPSVEVNKISVDDLYVDPNDVIQYERLLHLEDGRALTIIKNADDEQEPDFEKTIHELKDVAYEYKPGTIKHPVTNIIKEYHYITEYKNGNADYFIKQENNDITDFRTLAARKDKYGNCIFFEFNGFDSNSSECIKITDTWGRTIRLEKAGNSLKWTSSDEALAEQINVKYVTANTDGSLKLTQVVNQESQVTYYNHTKYDKNTQFARYASPTYNSNVNVFNNKYIPYMILTNIIHPTGAETNYEYEAGYWITNLMEGQHPYFILNRRYDKYNGVVCNEVKYSYTSTDDMYVREHYSQIAELPDDLKEYLSYLYGRGDNYLNAYLGPLFVLWIGFRFIPMENYGQRIKRTIVTKPQNLKEAYDFSKRRLLTKSNVIQDGKLIEDREYNYGNKNHNYRLLLSEKAKRYAPNDNTQYVGKTVNLEYDNEYDEGPDEVSSTNSSRANVVNMTETYSEDASNDQIVEYNYTKYSEVKYRSYKKDSSVTMEEVNNYNSDQKTVKCKEVLENSVLKEKTEYEYNSGYCMTKAKHYYSSVGSLESSTSFYETIYSYGQGEYHHLPISIEITGVKDADGNSSSSIRKRFKYDVMGRVVEETDPNGNTATYTYDRLGRLTKTEHPDLDGQIAIQSLAYDDVNNTVTVTNENGYRTRCEYSPLGKIQSIYYVNGGKDVLAVKYEYDENERLTSEIVFDGNGSAEANKKRTTAYTHDAFGRVLSKAIKAINYKERYEYTDVYTDSSGKYMRIKKTIDGDGVNAGSIETATYLDQLGRVVKESLGADSIISYEYDKVGNKIKQTDPKLNITLWEYDYAGRVTKTILKSNGIEQASAQSYDALGNMAYVWDYLGHKTEYVYDSAGRLVKRISPFDTRSAVTKHYYDAAGNLIWQKTYQGDYWQEIEYRYDTRNRLTDTYQYTDSARTKWIRTSYKYDGMGNKLEVHHGYTNSSNQCHVARYTYDRFVNVTSIIDPMGNTEQYKYSSVGILEYKIDRNGNKTTYAHDTMDRLTKQSVVADNIVTEQEISYTVTGQKLSETSREYERGKSTNPLQIRYKYNNKGLLERQTDPDGVTKEYAYDSNGNCVGFKLFRNNAATPEINLCYSYDDLNRLYLVKKDGVNGTTIAEYGYDKNGNRKTLKYPQSNMEAAYSYNNVNLVVSMENKRSGTLISSCSYTYYLDGNVSAKTDKTASKTNITSYKYDRLGQLTEESTSGSKITYEYDQYFNRSRMSLSGAGNSATDYQYNENNWLITETKETGSATETFSYGYDLNSNQCYREWEKTDSASPADEPGEKTDSASPADEPGQMKFRDEEQEGDTAVIEWREYNGFNQLISVHRPPLNVSYRYRPDGLRHSKVVSNPLKSTVKEVIHHWNGQNIVSEAVNGIVQNKYLRGINLIALQYGNALSYYLFNLHGDVIQLVDKDGKVVREYGYDAFGNDNARDGGKEDSNPFRYCGEYWDSETGTVYLRARCYNPRIGRFSSEDSVRSISRLVPNRQKIIDSLSLNLYSYCHNNPIMYIDPKGNSVTGALILIGGVLVLSGCSSSSGAYSTRSGGGGSPSGNGFGRSTTTPNPIPSPTPGVTPTAPSENLISFLMIYEEFSTMPYRGQDSQNRTVGYGHVIDENTESTKYNNGITKDEAVELLKRDIYEKAAQYLDPFLGDNSIILNQQQYDALLSFTFNTGPSWLTKYEDLRNILISGNITYDAMYNEFMTWTTAGGGRSLGIYRRRMDELNIFFYGDYSRNYHDKPDWF